MALGKKQMGVEVERVQGPLVLRFMLLQEVVLVVVSWGMMSSVFLVIEESLGVAGTPF